MDKPHITTIVGTRPNFVKLAALSPEIRKVADETIINTGQHHDYNLSKLFFEDMNIPAPDFHLNVPPDSPCQQLGEMITRLDPVLKNNHPDAVIVFGDTNSSLAGALAAVKMKIPVIHIEAGCRSGEWTMPEETNRIMIDHISRWFFCPTKNSARNLELEGIWGTEIFSFTCGDVMVDLIQQRPKKKFTDTPAGTYYLLTIHREENDNLEKLKEIFKGFDGIKEDIIFPCHPRIRKHIEDLNLRTNIIVEDPVGYWEMRELEIGAKKIITDSGGVQKEAYLLGVPCVTLRKSTEWRETLTGSWNILTSGKSGAIQRALTLIPRDLDYCPGYFGKPGVCERISKKIAECLNG